MQQRDAIRPAQPRPLSRLRRRLAIVAAHSHCSASIICVIVFWGTFGMGIVYPFWKKDRPHFVWRR